MRETLGDLWRFVFLWAITQLSNCQDGDREYFDGHLERFLGLNMDGR